MAKSTTTIRAKDRDRDRFYVQKNKHGDFQRLSQGEDAPFKQMKDAWILAAALGFRTGRREPLKGGTQHVGFWHYLSPQEDVPLLQAIAIAETGDVTVLGTRGEVIRIAEEYANGGVDLLIDLERPDRDSTLRAIAAMVIEEYRKHRSRGPSPEPSASGEGPAEGPIAALIAMGEGARLEFKQTARWNERKGEKGDRDQVLEAEVVQAIAGFMNARGGTLLIGVHDEQYVTGLDADYRTFSRRKGKDGFEAWLTDLLEHTVGKPAITNVSVSFPKVDGVEVCRVDVTSAKGPVYVKETERGRTEDSFYVRLNNTTRKLTTKETIEYIDSRWR